MKQRIADLIIGAETQIKENKKHRSGKKRCWNWWAHQGSNLGLTDYESVTLTN